MEHYKLKVERCFTLISHQLGCLICLIQDAAILIEQALAIVQQCNDHTDERSIERSHCLTRLCNKQRLTLLFLDNIEKIKEKIKSSENNMENGAFATKDKMLHFPLYFQKYSKHNFFLNFFNVF